MSEGFGVKLQLLDKILSACLPNKRCFWNCTVGFNLELPGLFTGQPHQSGGILVQLSKIGRKMKGVRSSWSLHRKQRKQWGARKWCVKFQQIFPFWSIFLLYLSESDFNYVGYQKPLTRWTQCFEISVSVWQSVHFYYIESKNRS